MAAPEGHKHGSGSSPDLPAPWQNPWGLLGRDLLAVWASLGLGLRELWRRNGEGKLGRPAFWPKVGAPLFWPLVAVTLVVLSVLGGRPLLSGRHRPPIPSLAAGAIPGPQAEGTSVPDSSSRASHAVALPAVPEPSVPATAVLEPLVSPPVFPQPREFEAPAAALPERNPGATEPGAPAAPPVPPPDPLLQELASDDPEAWIRATRAEPGASRLDLLVIDRFGSLAGPQRLALAEQWQRRAEALGYEDLRLLDGQGRLLARRALVGSGMILLEIPAAPPEA